VDFCRKESMYRVSEGTMSTTERPKGISRPDLKEIMQDVDHQAEARKAKWDNERVCIK